MKKKTVKQIKQELTKLKAAKQDAVANDLLTHETFLQFLAAFESTVLTVEDLEDKNKKLEKSIEDLESKLKKMKNQIVDNEHTIAMLTNKVNKIKGL